MSAQNICTISLMGTPRIVVNGKPIKFAQRKSTGLVAYLALTPGPQRREFLSTFFWPVADSQRAYGYFRNLIWDLNRTTASQLKW